MDAITNSTVADAASQRHQAAGPTPLPKAAESSGYEGFRAIDRMTAAFSAPATAGISPAALALAYFDWCVHLAMAPGKRMELAIKAMRKIARLQSYLAAACAHSDTPSCIEPLPGDNRFAGPEWKKPPFCWWAQAFLLNQQWWHNVTHGVPGVAP